MKIYNVYRELSDSSNPYPLWQIINQIKAVNKDDAYDRAKFISSFQKWNGSYGLVFEVGDTDSPTNLRESRYAIEALDGCKRMIESLTNADWEVKHERQRHNSTIIKLNKTFDDLNRKKYDG